MAAELLVTPSRALDADATPYSGAKWYFYQTGTLTPQNVFSDAGLSTPLGSVVTADSGGKFPNVYFDATKVYRGILKNADGSVTLHDIDPISSGVLTTLTGSDGSSLVGFIHSGVGATKRTLQDKERDTVSIKDFGGNGDGATDNAAAVLAAVTSLGSQGGDILFPRGTYFLATEVTLTSKSNIRFVGSGATIKGDPVRSYLNFDACTNISFEGITFDSRFGEIATYTSFATGERQVPIRFLNGSYLSVQNCTFNKLYTVHVLAKNSSHVSVWNNTFTSPLQDQDQYLSFVEAQTCGGSITVTNNRFIGATTTRNDRSPSAVSASGITGRLCITDNYATHCGRNNTGTHRLGVFDIYSDAVNVSVSNNVAANCREQFMRLSTTAYADVRDNFVTIAAEADTTYSAMTVESGSFPAVGQPICKDITIEGNTFIDAANRQAFAIGVISYDWGAGARSIKVSGNYIQGPETAFIVYGPFSTVEYTDNTVKDVKALISTTLDGGLTLTTTLGTEANSKFENLVIEGNDVEIRTSSTFIPVSLSTNRGSPYTGTVGNFYFRRNRMTCTTPGTTYAVNAIFNASVQQGRVFIEDNHISGYTTPFYVRSMKRAKITDNYAAGFTAAYTTDGSVGLIEAQGNRRTDAALSGQATLSAGAVVISNTEILTGDRIEVWRENAGGTPGHIYANPADIVNGTSLKITSTSGTDTSVVGWRIVGR